MRLVRPAIALSTLLLALGLVAGGCGGGGSDEASPPPATETDGSSVDGAAVWKSASCGGCHALAAAGSTGSVGPDLDDLRPDTETVASQVRIGGGGHPDYGRSLSDDEIRAVAEYVASNAGR
ncbi:MAG: cytochrome c [Thermoleophilia bacterium]|nr:cytochrome c [Thermoleophilia bacterium]MDH5333756.1 cytochrome c [Thermoleophilia bacterium]